MHELEPSLPVVELGGCLGVVACLTNRRLMRPDRHVVVEAHPDLISVLRTNRDGNGAGFEIVHAALAYRQDRVEFHQGGNILAGRLAREGGRRFTVPAVTLTHLLNTSAFERCTLVCDIEGAEVDLIENDSATLAERVMTLIIEWHPYVTGAAAVTAYQRQLEALGFELRFEAGGVSAYRNRRLG